MTVDVSTYFVFVTLLSAAVGVVGFFVGAWLIRKWKKARRRGRRVIVRATRELTAREIQLALSVSPEEPLWLAIHQLLEEQIEETVAESLDVSNQFSPALLSYYNGAAAHLQRFQSFLLEAREDGLKAVEQEE